jgi:probable HAF family extracellular repeat protein
MLHKALLLLPLLAAPLLAQAEIKYKVTDIGVTTSFNFNTGPYLNNKGEIAGTVGYDASNAWTSFLYTGGAASTVAQPGSSVYFAGLNDNGVVAGSLGGKAALWQNGVATEIGAAGSAAAGVNNHGVAVGSVNNGGRSNAAIFSNGQTQVLSTRFGSASAINDSGVVAGTVDVTDEEGHVTRDGFVYQNGAMTTFGAGPAHEGVFVEDISEQGTVVGMAGMDGGDHIYAYTWNNGQMTDLGALYTSGGGRSWSSAKAINSLNQVVGFSAANRNFQFHAFLYENGAMVDLNSLIDPSLGLPLDSANGINDQGQILATACDDMFTFTCKVVLLDPMSPVPEPATYGMLLGGLGLIGLIARRRRSA